MPPLYILLVTNECMYRRGLSTKFYDLYIANPYA